MTGSIAIFFLVTFGAVALCMVAFRFLPAKSPRPMRAVDIVMAREAEFRDIYDADLLRDESLSTISFWDSLLQRFDWVEIMKRHLSEAGMSWSVGRLTMFMLVAGTSTLGCMRFLTVIPTWMTVAAALMAGAAPYLVVLRRRARRLRRVEAQLPDALDTLARALRAGHTIQAALELLVVETPAPLGFELRKVADARALGMSFDTAIDQLAQRVPVSEVSEFVAAVMMQSRTGGKLHEVLGRLSETMRDNEALKSEIEAISAHGKMTGMILTLMPVGIGIILTYTNPGQMALLWGSPLGRDLVGIAIVCLVAAHFVIRRLVDIRI